MARYHQGKFIPRHPEKYGGDINNITYRSSYEQRVFFFLDSNANIKTWCSEETAIPYIKPTDKRWHRYFPDLYVEYIDNNGNIQKEIIEIKPKTQTRRPRANSKHLLYEQAQFAINIAKWSYAKQWCNQRGIQFRLLTENEIYH